MDNPSIEKHHSKLRDVTHILYAALYEMDDLLSGWRDNEQIKTNTKMFENLMNIVSLYSPSLRHNSLLQGTKAYGIHVEPMKAPAKEKNGLDIIMKIFIGTRKIYLNEYVMRKTGPLISGDLRLYSEVPLGAL